MNNKEGICHTFGWGITVNKLVWYLFVGLGLVHRDIIHRDKLNQ